MIRERFWELCSRAEDSYDGPELESVLVEVLRLIDSCPDARLELARCFIDLVRQPDRGSWEIVEFCMHNLRWPEVRRAVVEDLEKAKADQDGRAVPILSQILAAFDPAWPNADLYGNYKRDTGDLARENS
jgi:hypothetical protein